jgi:predicted Zn finger-like uncharacterized protein
MPIRIECPGCQASYAVADDLRGKKIRCRKCQAVVAVGGAARPASSEATQARPPARRGPAPAARRRDDEDDRPRRRRDDDDENDRPRRRRRPDDDEERSGTSPLVWVGAGVGGLVVVAAVVVIVWLNSGTKLPPRATGNEQVARNNGPGGNNQMPFGGMRGGPGGMRGMQGGGPGMQANAGGAGDTDAAVKPVEEGKPPEKKPEVALPPVANDADLDKRIYKRLLKSTAFIMVLVQRDGRVGVSMGSGSLIDKTNRLVLTNYHVVTTSQEAIVFFPTYDKDGRLIAELDYFMKAVQEKRNLNVGRVVKKDDRHDLALIQLDKLPEGDLDALPIATTPPSVTDRVFSVGNPEPVRGGALWVPTPGHVRSLQRKRQWDAGNPGDAVMHLEADVILTDSPTNHGDSGGPVVNTHCQMVAVVEGGVAEANALSIFIDISEVKAFLKEYEGQTGSKLALETGPAIQSGDSSRIPALLADLDGKDDAKRLQAVALLGQMGPEGQLAVPRLIRALKDKDATLRNFAEAALNKIGVSAKDIPTLVPLVNDTSLQVRLVGLQLLAKIGPEAQPALDGIVKLADDAEAKVREKATQAIGRIGTPSDHDAYMPVLAKALKDRDAAVRAAAAEAIATVPLTEADVPTLAELLRGNDLGLSRAGARALSKLGPKAKKAVPALIKALKGGDNALRAAALEALAGVGGADAKEALPEILPALKDNDPAIRRSAIAAVGGMGEDAKEAVAPLAEALKDPELVRPALESLRKLGPVAGSAAPAVAELLQHGQENVIPAIRTIQAIKPKAKDSGAASANLITLLSRLGPSKKEDVELREAITDALGEMGKNSLRGPASVVSKLLRALNDDIHPGTRMGAAMALGKIGPPAARVARTQLQRHAQYDEIIQVRDACNNALNRILNQ